MLSGLRVSATRVKEENHGADKEESKASFKKASEGVYQDTNCKDCFYLHFWFQRCNHNTPHEPDVVTSLSWFT